MRHLHPLVIGATVVTVAVGVALSFATPAAAQTRDIDVQHSTITIHVFKSGLFRAFADDHLIQAPLAEGSIDESAAAPHVELVVDAHRLRVLDPGLSAKNRDEVQARMLGPEVLDATRFEQIRFHSTAIQQIEPDHWVVHGDLDLHGQIHQVVVKVARENGRYNGLTTLRQSDFAMTPISVAGGTVKVKDEIAIEFDIVTADR